jgi:hypothetical protein
MRTLRLISTTTAILMLGAGVVSAQSIKTDETVGAPAAQQSAPAKMAPVVKSDQSKTSEKIGQAAPTAPVSANKQQTMDKGAPAGAATKVSSDAKGRTDVKSKHAARHIGARYASGHHRSLYNSYRGDRGYRGCRGHYRHSWMPWLGC